MVNKTALNIHFYRSAYRNAVLALNVMMLIVLILVLAIFFSLLARKPEQYYATSSAGGLARVAGFDAPNDVRVTIVRGPDAYQRSISF